MKRIDVHPRFAATYASFFFEGTTRLWGDHVVRYSTDGFPRLAQESGVVLMRVGGPEPLNLCIAPDDMADVDRECLAWSDVYAKVNLDRALVPAPEQHKVVPAGPTFGVRAWPPIRAAAAFAQTRRFDPLTRARVGGRGFWAQYAHRLPESAYRPQPSDDDYVFFMAWPWKHHATVNPPRARFVSACKARTDIRFEGGFAPRRRNDMPELDGLFADRRVPIREYVARTGRSALVFNTPAVHDCLGWKLGEFLALGKAIVTLPITRELPEPLEHGRHVHVVDGTEEGIRDGIDRILGDVTYRRNLERNARAYYDEWLRPERLMQRLCAGGA